MIVLPSLDGAIAWAAALIEFAGAISIVAAAIRGLAAVALARGEAPGIAAARLLLADGILAALGLKTAATLLKTLELRSWRAIAVFTAILALRTVIKQGIAWEARRVRATWPAP